MNTNGHYFIAVGRKKKEWVDGKSRSSSETVIATINAAPGDTIIFGLIEPTLGLKFKGINLSVMLNGYAPVGAMQILLCKFDI